jgi:Fe-S cluster assembly ATP-binding protein
MNTLLDIKDLHVSIEGKPTLSGVNLKIKSGEIHAVMGPNGSGKSTLSNAVMGNPRYEITKGEIMLRGKSILDLEPSERALSGLFLGFQYPKEIAGITLEEFLLAAYRAKQAHQTPDKPPILVFRFKRLLNEAMEKLGMPAEFAERFLNYGFSGGEKKKAEALQMAILKPELAILDETDSGLDVDALRTISENINENLKQNPSMSILLITHYQRILKHVRPDHVHVMKAGRIIKSGGHKLAEELEEQGYEKF